MSSYTISGRIEWIGEVREVGKNGFLTLDFVLEVESKYRPQMIKFKVVKDRASAFRNQHRIGEKVDVRFDVGGRRYDNPKTGEVNYFNELTAWDVRAAGKGESAKSNAPKGSREPGDDDDFPPF